MIPLNINFLKSQRTVGKLRKVVMEAQSQSKQSVSTRGDKFVARTGNKIPALGLVKGFRKHSFPSISPSLTPRTFNYTKINNARRNSEWQQQAKDLEIPIL